MIDWDRIEKLSTPDNILNTYNNDQLAPGEIKVGDVNSNITLGARSIESNSANPADPGFSFSDKGSEIRQGAKLDLDGDYKKFFFKKGEQQLHPLGNIKASSTTDPLPTIMPTLRTELLSSLDVDFRKAIDNLRSLYAI